MDAATRERAELLAQKEKRSVSNLIAVLVDREWERNNQPQMEQERAA